jgi:hypothetical protein
MGVLFFLTVFGCAWGTAVFEKCGFIVHEDHDEGLHQLHTCYILPLVTIPNKDVNEVCKEEVSGCKPLSIRTLAVAVVYYSLLVACEAATGGDFGSPFAAAKVAVMFGAADEHAKFAFCYLVLVKPRVDVASSTRRMCVDEMSREISKQEISHEHISFYSSELANMDHSLLDTHVGTLMRKRLDFLMQHTTRKRRGARKSAVKKKSALSTLEVLVVTVGVLGLFIFAGSMICIFAGY